MTDTVQATFDIDLDQFAKRLKRLQDHFASSRRGFARLIGVPQANMTNYVTGTQPPVSFLAAIANKLPQVNLSWLLLGKGPMLHTQNLTQSAPVKEVKTKDGETYLQETGAFCDAGPAADMHNLEELVAVQHVFRGFFQRGDFLFIKEVDRFEEEGLHLLRLGKLITLRTVGYSREGELALFDEKGKYVVLNDGLDVQVLGKVQLVHTIV